MTNIELYNTIEEAQRTLVENWKALLASKKLCSWARINWKYLFFKL